MASEMGERDLSVLGRLLIIIFLLGYRSMIQATAMMMVATRRRMNLGNSKSS